MSPTSLLEPIAAGQTRFRLQGLAPDGRGIAVGRETLMIFPSLDRLVGFLGAYSEEGSLDELIQSLTLERARRSTGSQALLLRCAGSDSYQLDRLGRLCAAVQGQVFTGSGTTFVRGRDRIGPFGYDLAVAVAGGLGPDALAVVDHDHQVQYTSIARLDPVELIQRLELRALPLPAGGLAESPDLCGLAEMALVLVAPGLADRVLSYLWSNQVALAGVRVALAGERNPSLLLRLRQPSGGILSVLHGIPGVELYVPISPRAAIELGYRHPIHLASASSCLPGDEMYLFRGRVGRVERLESAPQFLDGRHLVRAEVRVRTAAPSDMRGVAGETLKVPLELRATASIREPRAALVPWSQSGVLRRLIYLLPPTALGAARIALMPEGMLVLTGSSLVGAGAGLAAGVGAAALIPLGARIVEVAPGVLVPDGHELWPRVRPQLVRELLGLGPADHALFLGPGQDALRLSPEALLPLDAAMIRSVELAAAEVTATDLPDLGQPSLTHTNLGRFALWGYGRADESGLGSAASDRSLPPGRGQ